MSGSSKIRFKPGRQSAEKIDSHRCPGAERHGQTNRARLAARLVAPPQPAVEPLALARLAAMQKATLTTPDFGIEPTDGLFGSAEWWEEIAASGAITLRQKPRIDLYFAPLHSA